MARGNHEICERAGPGFFRFLDPTLAKSEAPPACTDFAPAYTATVAGRSFIVMDSSDAGDECRNDTCDSAPYAAEFAGLQPAPGSVFISHRPIWGIGRDFTLNRTLQQALGAWNGKLPDGIDLALAGHMHMFEILSFEDRRSPQLIVGTGGTKLDRTITRRLAGMTLGGATVSYGRAEREFGFIVLTPQPERRRLDRDVHHRRGQGEVFLRGQADRRELRSCRCPLTLPTRSRSGARTVRNIPAAPTP